ncbi:MAG: adenylosuccinate lyase [Candidatus Aureabacteria bacterium]|nr:adenylosuccinate lyase [Candidatus Auribacterota bacterium]
MIKNVLASRYASTEMKNIWREEGKIILEREFWIAVLKAQRALGMRIPSGAVPAYEKTKKQVDLKKITEREKILRHDVKARIEEFNSLAGFEEIHKGLTSRDLTDNVEQYQILKSLKLIQLKTIAALKLLSKKAWLHKTIVLAARTHNVTAQLTTLGKRLAMSGEEILIALRRLTHLIESYPLRGLKGAVGTLIDQQSLLGKSSKLNLLQTKVAKFLGFKQVLYAVGQVYPRSLDFEVISALYQLGAGFSDFAKTIRLMAGQELATEGFQKGQVGSSAMPHKMNSRNCERINGFHVILSGYLAMASGLAGDQWNEGDVSCSVVRRVALPDSFYALDGLLETAMTVFKEMHFFKHRLDSEVKKYLPFLCSTVILMETIKNGMGREKAHQIIKEQSHAVLTEWSEGKTERNDLTTRLAAVPGFPLTIKELDALVKHPEKETGLAAAQTERFCREVEKWAREYPEHKKIQPEKII